MGATPSNHFPMNASLTLTHGVSLSYGNLAIGGDTGGFVALDGASTVTNDSTFLATGGRYLNGPFVLNGSMTVSHGSTADFRHATLEGHGTVNIDAGSVVDMNTVLAGLHVNVAKGGDRSAKQGRHSNCFAPVRAGFAGIHRGRTCAGRTRQQPVCGHHNHTDAIRAARARLSGAPDHLYTLGTPPCAASSKPPEPSALRDRVAKSLHR